MTYHPIQCGLYDYIEIACIRGYQLEIKLDSGKSVTGKARSTRIQNGEEFLLIEEKKPQNGKSLKLRLDQIATITVLDETAEFKTVNFK